MKKQTLMCISCNRYSFSEEQTDELLDLIMERQKISGDSKIIFNKSELICPDCAEKKALKLAVESGHPG